MNTNHTPEPWKSHNGSIFSGDNRFTLAHFILYFGTHDNAENAQRAVACVNALAGLNPEAVPDAVAALREILAVPSEQFANARQFQAWCELKTRAALAKLDANQCTD